MSTLVHLPDLTSAPLAATTGWSALATAQGEGGVPLVAVPSLADARACALALVPEEDDPCALYVIAIDPPDGTVVIEPGAGVIEVTLSRGAPQGPPPVLRIHPLAVGADDITIEGAVQGPCRDRIVFTGAVTASMPDGEYTLSVDGYPDPRVHLTIAIGSFSPLIAQDRCALTLAPRAEAVVPTFVSAPSGVEVRPPLLAVDRAGCVARVWSLDAHGRALVPREGGGVDLLARASGGLVATLAITEPVRDAIFWRDVIAVLTATAIRLYDRGGCPIDPAPWRSDLDDAIALAISGDGALVVIQRGAPNVVVLRRDGSRIAPPAVFSGRGYYASLRSAAIVFDAEVCAYKLDPARVGEGCCVEPARLLTDDEALFFRLVDDLPDLRARVAYPNEGWVIVGSADDAGALDAGRPGTAWHRVLLFGEIPEGCAVTIETRASDDVLAGDPFVAAGWSPPVTATSASAVTVSAPGDARTAIADVMVLAGPGRYLWLRLTLKSDGARTPKIRSIVAEHAREGTSRFLPKVYRDATPDDDFLRRWLALFEATAWSGVSLRLNTYADLFDARTAPEAMLPFLAGFVDLPVPERLKRDPERLRRLLTRANEIARARGTIDGLVLIVELVMGITIQIVESFHTRSRFILGADPVLGGDTILTIEPSPVVLDDGPALGCGCLLPCDERDGTIPYRFDVLVAAHDVCATEDLALLRALVDREKPAHTIACVRLTAPSGWAVGMASVVGQEVREGFDRQTRDPTTFGIALASGPPRPRPLGEGLVLGMGSHLPASSRDQDLRLEATVGRTTRVGA